MNWKCCKLKFNNATFLVATNGELLRIRGGGAIQEECELIDCDEDKINEVSMKLDIVLQETNNGGE